MSWRALFAIAAFFNIVVGGALLFASGPVFNAFGMPTPDTPMFIQVSGWLVVVFGLGYARVARDPAGNRGIVFMGVIGKAAMPVLMGWYTLDGAAPLGAFLLTLGDLVFAALFAVFLLMTPRPQPLS